MVARGGIEPPTRGFSAIYSVQRSPLSATRLPKSLNLMRSTSKGIYYVLRAAGEKLQQLQREKLVGGSLEATYLFRNLS